MSISKRQLLNLHASSYVRATMADRLKQEGFVSMNNDDLHWFRVINGEVVHTVIFYTQYTAMPIDLNIGFGCFPLFVKPLFPPNVYIYGLTRNHDVLSPGFPISKMHNRYTYSKDILVGCPADELSGADILDKVVEIFKTTRDAESCYAYHKSRYITVHQQRGISSSPFTFASVDFMNEVVYFNDLDILPDCKKSLIDQLEVYYDMQRCRKLIGYELNEVERLERLKEALNSDLQEYRKYLDQLKLQNIKLLMRKVDVHL